MRTITRAQWDEGKLYCMSKEVPQESDPQPKRLFNFIHEKAGLGNNWQEVKVSEEKGE